MATRSNVVKYYAESAPSASGLALNYDVVGVSRSNRLPLPNDLGAKLEALQARIEALERGTGRETVVVLRELSKAEAKTEVMEYFKSHPSAYPSDAAVELRLDSALVRDIVRDLIDEGHLG